MVQVPDIYIDHDSSVPVYRQIADAVRDAAREGRLSAGRRLPPTRDLARQLGVNRQTVVAAYEFLAAEGWVRSHTGRGTFLEAARVAAPAPASATPAPAVGSDAEVPAAQDWLTTFSRAVDAPNVRGLLSFYRTANADGISFAGSYPARDLMPVESFAAAVAGALADEGTSTLIYGPTAGHQALREELARQMRQAGSNIGSDEILVTNGAQQAIELVFNTFLERGDPVVIEQPTYTGALSVLASIGARTIGVQVDEQGMRPDSLALALGRHRPRLMYVQPTFHNPTTAVMGLARRRELLEIAAANRCVVLEDDWANGLRFSGEPLPTLHALDRAGHVIYLSTFSKKLLPGLRVGWAAAPKPVIRRLVALKQIRDCGTSPLLQAALHRFLGEGGLERHLDRVIPAYRDRRDRMIAALEAHAPEGMRWTCPDGGLFLWVALPQGIDSEELAAAAAADGVLFSHGAMFQLDGEGRGNLRLGFSSVSPEKIEAGVATLCRLIGQRCARATLRDVETVPLL